MKPRAYLNTQLALQARQEGRLKRGDYVRYEGEWLPVLDILEGGRFTMEKHVRSSWMGFFSRARRTAAG